jgi:murein DD-endopeptidase MepM/ murein hydrolase activator NlpD
MKLWTLTLHPHDRPSAQPMTSTNWHFTALVGVLVLSSFLTTFMFARERAIQDKNLALRESNRRLELRASAASMAPSAQPAAKASLSDAQVQEIEARARAEYDKSISAITAELQQLYEMETKARSITGMAPRKARPAELSDAAAEGGKGGGSGVGVGASLARVASMARPPQVIYGVSRPTADLLLQEIRIRRSSLGDLVKAMEVEKDRVSRMPSIWPLFGGVGVITSNYGYRVDPINRRIRFHAGTDISAPYGTKVRSTARGTVTFSGYDGEYGNVVKVSHGNGLETWYCHLSARDVETGAVVDREQLIGRVGSTGRSTGNHLHFEVHVNGKTVDGEKYFD